MKVGEQERLSEEIARKLERSDLVSKCLRVALLGNVTHRKVRDCSTHIKREFQKPPFRIFSESGLYSLGTGEEIKVV